MRFILILVLILCAHGCTRGERQAWSAAMGEAGDGLYRAGSANKPDYRMRCYSCSGTGKATGAPDFPCRFCSGTGWK